MSIHSSEQTISSFSHTEDKNLSEVRRYVSGRANGMASERHAARVRAKFCSAVYGKGRNQEYINWVEK